MRFWILTLCFVITYAAFQARAGSRPEISVLSGSEIKVLSGLPVQLKDIGAAGFVSSDLMAQAGSLVILEALTDQETRTYTNAEMVRILKEKIATNTDLSSQKWTYFVPETVKVTGQKNYLSPNRLTTSIQESLREKCDSCVFRLSNLKVPEVKETSAITALDLETSPLKMSGSFLLPLRLTFAGGSDKVYYITGQVSGRTRALVANRSLQMGEKITKQDVKEQESEIGFSNDAFATTEDLDGKTAGRQIQMGRVIYKSDLKREVVVLRGQVIRVVSGNDIFEVSTQMQAEDNGAIGDQIRLKNPETQKLMSGRVVDRGVVRVQ